MKFAFTNSARILFPQTEYTAIPVSPVIKRFCISVFTDRIEPYLKYDVLPDAIYVKAAANVTRALASSEPPTLVHFIPIKVSTDPQNPKATEPIARARQTCKKTEEREHYLSDKSTKFNFCNISYICRMKIILDVYLSIFEVK